jgi:hypothetical protein
LISGRVPGAHSTVISVRGGREEEKKKQPDNNVDAQMITLSIFIIDGVPLSYSFVSRAAARKLI